MRVWDAATGTLLHELEVEGQAQGVAFYGNDRLVVVPQDGALLIMSIDPQGLVKALGSSLTRGFTVDECSRFNFGDSCPTLKELRGSSP